MPFQVARLSSDQIAAKCDAIAEVYYGAYSLPPYFENENDIIKFKKNWPALIQKPGFSLAVATDGNKIVGFSYGWTLKNTDDLFKIFSENLAANEVHDWTHDSFEIGDFAIFPEYQSKGLGTQIYNSLFKNRTHSRGVLKTHCSESVAVMFYRKRGWETVVDRFIWGPKNLPYTAMGLKI